MAFRHRWVLCKQNNGPILWGLVVWRWHLQATET